MRFIIGGIQRTSLLDYPDKISAIVFTQGCNFRCGYCHNPNLLENKSKNAICDADAFFDFLKTRKGKLDGIVITGGESTLQPELKEFVSKVKEMGFLVKLDTNGYKPDIVNDLLGSELIDYIAMDIKAPLNKYELVTGIKVDTNKIKESVNLILNSKIDYEFRTTVLPCFLKIEDFEKIGKIIKGAKKYFLQKFMVQSKIYDNSLVNEKNYEDNDFNTIVKILENYVEYVSIR